MLQLNPPIPLNTVKGRGFAHFLIDYGQEHDLIWVVFLRDSGECWSISNKDVRLEENFTMGTQSDPNFRIGPPRRMPLTHWESGKTD